MHRRNGQRGFSELACIWVYFENFPGFLPLFIALKWRNLILGLRVIILWHWRSESMILVYSKNTIGLIFIPSKTDRTLSLSLFIQLPLSSAHVSFILGDTKISLLLKLLMPQKAMTLAHEPVDLSLLLLCDHTCVHAHTETHTPTYTS